ncbi:MAG: helix-turn-helix domain-containing protein [Muribaculaceae bacterium]|nr:helix-turn-helix domain-containing protein [Muribaculaceae bacterium]
MKNLIEMAPLEIETIPRYAEILGFSVSHPQVAVIDLAEMPEDRLGTKRLGFYCVLLKEHYNGVLDYGRGRYNYSAGTMLFISPGQTIGISIEPGVRAPKGYLLMFHPDFIVNTSLGQRMKDYFFFSYDSNEALLMSEDERGVMRRHFGAIMDELATGYDRFTKEIVASSIETILNYCLRFYDRQFLSRKVEKRNILSRLDAILEDYYAKDRNADAGIPSVRYCASRIPLSPNYFGDLVKKESGKSAQEYIHAFIVNKAKTHLLSTAMNISEVAYHLGFVYPHHFSRLFKRVAGCSPHEYILQNKDR